MAEERFVVSRKPDNGHFVITRESTKGHIYSTEVATFQQAQTWIRMSAEDKDFARQVCERMAEHYENIIREEKHNESRNQSKR